MEAWNIQWIKCSFIWSQLSKSSSSSRIFDGILALPITTTITTTTIIFIFESSLAGGPCPRQQVVVSGKMMDAVIKHSQVTETLLEPYWWVKEQNPSKQYRKHRMVIMIVNPLFILVEKGGRLKHPHKPLPWIQNWGALRDKIDTFFKERTHLSKEYYWKINVNSCKLLAFHKITGASLYVSRKCQKWRDSRVVLG